MLPNVQVDGTLNVEGEVFIPAGTTFGDLESQIAVKADTSYVNGKYSGFKNYIINGNFDIWQRGDSFSPGGSASFFTADRWWLDNSNVATGLSASKQPGLVGKNSLYIQRTGGASMQIYQMVENQGNMSNKTFTFSALVRSAYNGTANFRIGDGRNGTNFTFTQTPVTLEANRSKKIVFTVQLGQVSADALFVGLITTCTSLYIDAVQMEEGSVATPFEQRPIGLELSLCQRYFQVIPKLLSMVTFPITTLSDHMTGNSAAVNKVSLLPTEMRVIPTINYTDLSHGFTPTSPLCIANKYLFGIYLHTGITGFTNPYVYFDNVTLNAEL